MSTAEILSLISTISYVAAALCFVLAVLFWFGFKIPSVIGDLSGRTAKKSIARMRANKENAGGQGYKTSAANANRGKITETIHITQKAETVTVSGKKQPGEDGRPETGLLANNRAAAVSIQQTEYLEENATTGLLTDGDATVPLMDNPRPFPGREGGKILTMLDEVMLIHTNEVIA